MRHQYLEADKLVFRTGDKGEKFYVILKGQVNILIAHDSQIMMSEEEYLIYLAKLKIYNEMELFYRVIQHNKFIYNVNPDTFEDTYMICLFKNKKNANSSSKVICELADIAGKLTSSFDPDQITQLNLSDKYIKNIEPTELTSYMNEKREVSVWKYYKVLSLTKGDSFGEIALQNYSNKR